MAKSYNVYQWIAAVILLLPGILPAAAETWSYARCVDYAADNNITLQKSKITESMSEVNVEEAKGAWQPTLDFTTSHSFSSTPFATSDNKVGYAGNIALNAGWTVWNGGAREKRIEKSELQLGIDRLASDQTLRSLQTDILNTYLNILYAREAIGICEQALSLSEAQAERARGLMESGKLSRVDYMRLKAQADADRYALVSAQSTYDTRRMELKDILELGLGADISAAPIDWQRADITAPLPSLEESYELALRTDLNLQKLQLAEKAAKIDVDIAATGQRPNITLNAGLGTNYSTPGIPFGYSIRNSFGPNVGINLNIPLADQRKTKSAVANARYQELSSQLDTGRRTTELAQLVESAFIDTRSAQANYTAALSREESAALTDELTNEQFSLGLVNPVELMTSHSDLIEARYAVLQAKYMALLGIKMIEYYRTSIITLPTE